MSTDTLTAPLPTPQPEVPRRRWQLRWVLVLVLLLAVALALGVKAVGADGGRRALGHRGGLAPRSSPRTPASP